MNKSSERAVERDATAVAGPQGPATGPPPVGTGIDSSAGRVTRVLTVVLLPFTTAWEVGKLVIRRCLGGSSGTVAVVARMIVGAARLVGHFVSTGASVLSPLVRPLRMILRWCGRGFLIVFGATGRVLALMGSVVARLGRSCGRAVVWTCGRVTDALVIVGLALRLVAELLAPALRRAGRVVAAVSAIVATAGAALATLMLTLLSALVRPLEVLARVVRSVVASVLHPLGACVVAIVRGIAILGTFVARLVARVIGLIVHALTAIGRLAARCLGWIAVVVGHVLRAVGRWAAPIGGAGAAILANLAVAGARGATALIGPGARAVGRASRTVLRSLAAAAMTVMGPLAGAVGRGAWAVGRTMEAIVRRISGALRSSSGRVVQGSLVAFGTARHQARIVPRSGTVGTLDPLHAPMDTPMDTGDIAERPLTAIFTATSHQNPYVPPGGSQVEAIVSVTADIATPDERSREAVEIFLLDCSGSMGHPWDKIRALRKATRAALEILPDGVWFAVVRGAETAEVVYPPAHGLVQASPTTRKEAVATLATLQPVGGTAIGRWLALASRLSALRPAAIHHALLLTDGKDEGETPLELDTAVAASVGRFQCDCRGIGSDWAVRELRQISSALLGSVDIIRQPADMEGDFRAIIDAALARQVEATLQVWVPEHAEVSFIRQVAPTIEDLTASARPIDAHTVEIPTGAWTTESREYHISVEVPAGPLGAEMLASRVSLMVGGRKHAQALVKAHWTDEASLFTPISHDVAHYTGQAELARAIQEGLEARRAGHEKLATDKLGRAVQLAAQSGRHATSQLLADVVDVEDAITGRVTLKAYVDDADEMALDARSTRTTRSGSTFDTPSPAGRESPTGDQRARI